VVSPETAYEPLAYVTLDTPIGRVVDHFHEKAGSCQAVFFLVEPTMRPTADQREAHLAFSLSFIEGFFVRLSIQPILDD